MPFVFVYGTLKRGFENHHLMDGAVFVGSAYTAASYSMLDGAFPVLREAGAQPRQVAGELYDVDDATLTALDDLEDTASGMYDRVETDIIMTDPPAAIHRAFIYVGCATYWDYRPASFYAKVDAKGRLDWKPDDENRS